MSFDKLKSLWNRAKNPNKNGSVTQRAQDFLSATLYKIPPAQTPQSIQQFSDHINIIATRKNSKPFTKKAITSHTLKPQLVKKCFQKLDPIFLSENYALTDIFFASKKQNNEKYNVMQDHLDEIEVCLFNQISSRFDEILSVIRTMESLQFIVVDNQKKIVEVRKIYFAKCIASIEKQRRVLAKRRKAENIKKAIAYIKYLKSYKTLSMIQEQQITDNQAYQLISVIRQQREQYNKFSACNNLQAHLQSLETSLKQCFSQKLNSVIFQYCITQFPYRIEFWKIFLDKADIFEDFNKEALQNTGALLLDQSMMYNEEEENVSIKVDNLHEKEIVKFIESGWHDGFYDSYKLRSQIWEFVEVKMQIFMLDFRNFCVQACMAKEIVIQNSQNLKGVLDQMTAKFCGRVFKHLFKLHKSLLIKIFNLTQLCFNFIYEQQKNIELSAQQIQKLKTIGKGFLTFSIHIVKNILNKLHESISLKEIHQSVDIVDFKEIIIVYEDICSYFKGELLAKLDKYIKIGENSRVFAIQEDLCSLYGVREFQEKKEEKIRAYLEVLHENAVNVELKQRLQQELWVAVDIPTYYYDSLHYLMTGESLNLRRNKLNINKQSSVMYETSVLMQSMYIEQRTKHDHSYNKKTADFRIIRTDIIIKGQSYKITESILLLVEIIEDYMTLVQLFPSLRQQISCKLNQIFRSYNASSSQLIVHRGALALKKINSKSIKAKHLALSSVCLAFLVLIMSYISQRIEIVDYDKLKSSYQDHIKIIVDKLHWILIQKSKKAYKQINLQTIPSKGTQIIVSNTKILYQILCEYYSQDILKQIFTEDILQLYMQPIKKLKASLKTTMETQSYKSDILFFYDQLSFLEDIIPKFKEYRLQAEDIIRSAFQQL